MIYYLIYDQTKNGIKISFILKDTNSFSFRDFLELF